MSLSGSYPSSFPSMAPLHYPLPNPYVYRRAIIQGKNDEQRPATTSSSSSSSSVNSSGNSSPAPSLASVASSEVSSPPPASPHTFNDRATNDFYSMIPKQFNPTTPVTATAAPAPSVPSYPSNNYPSMDFPSYPYDFYSNAAAAPKMQSLQSIPSLPAMPIQALNNDPSALYAAREFPAYDPLMVSSSSYDPSSFGVYSRNRLFDPRLYPPMRGYPVDEEWYADVKGKKRGGDKKRGRYDEDEAARKRARANQRSAAATNPTNKQRSIIHCGIPRAYLEKKNNGESVEVNDDDRVYFLYSPFFGKELDVYYADDDPFHRPLFRASALHKKFGCATNKMDMYLCRKKAKEGPKCGIFQCLCFDGRREEHGLFGLKAGTYFVSEDACAAFAEHAKEQRFRKKRTAKAKREKERLEKGQTDALDDDISSDEEEETPRAAPASNDRGVEMMVHMIQMFSKSNDNNNAKALHDNKSSIIPTAAIIPPAAIASSNPSA